MLKKNEIGIVQGRLSKKIRNLIQAFPRDNWEKEFFVAERLGFDGIEFIFDNLNNPILTKKGKEKIRSILNISKTKIFSVNCDYSMFNPLFGKTVVKSTAVIKEVIKSCAELNIPKVGLSFEDNSSILDLKSSREAIQALRSITNYAKRFGIMITLETSLSVINIKKLINEVGSKNLKINFDTGNSCSLGEDTPKAILELNSLIYSIHVKDRTKLFGTTVPLGTGDVDFNSCFRSLKEINFEGVIVIQGARGKNDIDTAKKYLKFVKKLLKEN